MSEKKGLTYSDAGVNITAGNEAVEMMKTHVQKTFRPEVLTGIGGFGGLFALNKGKYEEPVLVSGTDGVGTKLRVAFMMDKHDTIGIDAVAMCVNDILAQGAEPLFFLDYLAVGKLVPERVAKVVKGVSLGCQQAGCALIGGETAEMPGFYSEDEYDVAGFTVGVVDKKKIIDGSKIKSGDVLVGLPSSGIHSNGFSLARKVLFEVAGLDVNSQVEEFGRSLGEELLEPTRIYVKLVLPLIEKFAINGIAHITGGGLTENIPRILPEGTKVVIDSKSWPVPPVFKVIQQKGSIVDSEMRRTFNMGIGMVLIVPQGEFDKVMDELEKKGEKAYIIGRVEKGNPSVDFI